MNLKEAIQAYYDKFDEGPPIFGMPEEEAIAMIQEAIEKNQPIDEGAEIDIPEDARL